MTGMPGDVPGILPGEAVAPDGGHDPAPPGWSTCPGCGLQLPDLSGADDGRRNATSACWQLYGELIGYEFEHLAELGRYHQLMVDTYAAQHAGRPSPPIGVAFALIGLRLTLDEGVSGVQVRAAHQYPGNRYGKWPAFDRPAFDRAAAIGVITVADVLLAGSPTKHAELIERWARAVWSAWAPAHELVSGLVSERLPAEVRQDLLAVG